MQISIQHITKPVALAISGTAYLCWSVLNRGMQADSNLKGMDRFEPTIEGVHE